MPSVIIGLIIIYSLGIVSIIAVYVMDPLAEWYSTVVIVMCGIMSVFVTLDCTTINEYNLSSSGLTIFLNFITKIFLGVEKWRKKRNFRERLQKKVNNDMKKTVGHCGFYSLSFVA